jgi:hypothetical protein
MNRATKLAHGLDRIGGTHKRILLLAMAVYARANGRVRTSDRRLRDATELGREVFTRITQELEEDGWVRREEFGFTLAISKMEANQRFFMNTAPHAAKPEDLEIQTNNQGVSAPPNRLKEGYL